MRNIDGAIKVNEVIEEEVDRWVRRQQVRARERGQQVLRTRLLDRLAEKLGVCARQLQRYMSGETPMPVDKIVPFCQAVGSKSLVIFLGEELGLVLSEVPEAEEIDRYDICDEQMKNFKEFSEAAEVISKAFSEKPNRQNHRVMTKEVREAIAQLAKLLQLYTREVEEYATTRDK